MLLFVCVCLCGKKNISKILVPNNVYAPNNRICTSSGLHKAQLCLFKRTLNAMTIFFSHILLLAKEILYKIKTFLNKINHFDFFSAFYITFFFKYNFFYCNNVTNE